MIPLRATNYELSDRWPKKIILHHAQCRLNKPGEFKLDSAKYQTGLYNTINYRETKKDTNFHFMVELIKNDYEIIVSQPLMTKCIYEDLPIETQKDVHVCLMGDYDIDIPPNRLYTVVSYKIIIPIMRLFVLEDSDVYLHMTLSSNPNCTCPGEFVNMAILRNQIRSILRKSPIKRG